MQRADAWMADVAAERYLERCRLKTASLFDASCRLGALLRRDTRAMPRRWAPSASGIGLAFQLLDDVLDVSGPAERTGKPRGTDLLDGTVTLPLILARERDPELRGLDLRAVGHGRRPRPRRCATASPLTGALDEARALALGHVAAAKAGCDGLGLPEDREQALRLVADGVVERYA